MVEYKREVPKCTLFLVIGALTSHTLVLIGNLSTSHMLHGLGESSSGWASVGKSLSNALHDELNPAMDSVADSLTMSITAMNQVEQGIDVMLSMAGSTTDSALANLDSSSVSPQQVQQTKKQLMQQLRSVADRLVQRVSAAIDQLLEVLQPALNQVKEWLTTFGDKIQAALEEFGSTIDRVQKIFDSVIQQVSTSAGAGEEDMLYNTYTLFDTDKSGTIKVDDIQSVAALYGISALEGHKAAELFETYDADHKGGIDEEEYALFVNDPSIPGIMPLMLRTYSQKLATIAGAVAGARMRDEVSAAVVEYLSLVCAKNMNKLGWVSEALINGTVPVEFTADVLKNLALTMDNPNDLTLVEVGSYVVAKMLSHEDQLTQAVRLLADPAFWVSEGFNEEDQPVVLGRVVTWLAESRTGGNIAREALDLTGVSRSNLAADAEALVRSRQRRHSSATRASKASSDEELYVGNASKVLKSALLGGTSAAAKGDSKEVQSAVSRGQRARPESLLFASWLAANASQTAERHLQECFDYAGTSSGSLDSFANKVSNVIKKTQSFINTMAKYSTPKGIDKLWTQAQTFAENATDDIILVVDRHIDAQFAALQCQLAAPGEPCTATQAQLDVSMDLTGAFTFVSNTLLELKNVMPVVIDDLKFAKKEVTQVSKTMNTVMQILGLKAPPMFYTVSALYKTLWTLYFVFFALLTLSVLFYGFWASGFFGGPAAVSDDGYEAPRTLGERLRTLCSCCCACFKGCTDTNLCFWSVILLFELIVLVLFVVAVVICIIGGLEAFMSAGCAQVYILGDDQICTAAMSTMKTFLSTFWSNTDSTINVDRLCGKEQLLTCDLIQQQTVTAVKVSIVGGLLSSVLSFQMIVESAVLHERSRWRLMLEAEAKSA